MSFSTSLIALSTISSILAGWILPSTINFSKAILATSLLIGSKLERITASGVSSIIKSTPVNVSKVLIFLPSLPMILPFISSLGRATTCTVVSETWSAAHLWIAVVIISLDFLSASSLALVSSSLISIADSCFISLLTSSNNNVLASSLERFEILSSSALCSPYKFCTRSSSSWISIDFLFMLSSLFSSISPFLSNDSSLWISLLSNLWISFLLSRVSLSRSALSLCTSSLASNMASFFVDSASLLASSSVKLASFSKLSTLFFEAFCIRVYWINPTTPNIIIPISIPTTI